MNDELLNELMNDSPEPTAQPQQAPEPTPTPEPLPAAEMPKEEKRGRHKKTCTCDKCKAKNGTQAPADETPIALKPLTNTKVTDSNPLDLSEFKTNNAPITPQSANPGEVNAAKYITGGMLLILIDALAPAVIVKIFHYISPKTKETLKAKAVKMSDEQMEAIEPIANEAMKEVFLQMKPSQALIFAIFATYAGNALTAFADIPDLVKPEKPTKNV